MKRAKRSASFSSSDSDDGDSHKLSRVAVPLHCEESFPCTLPPTCSVKAPTYFPTASALESHYRSKHAFACELCSKIMPDDRFLNLHLAECHDPLLAIKAERGERTLKCFEVACPRLFATPKKRRLHLIDAHQYPKEFYFSLPVNGLNKLYEQFGDGVGLVRKEWKPRDEVQLRPAREGIRDSSPDPMAEDTAANELVHQAQDLSLVDALVPSQIQFGKRKAKGRAFMQT